MKPAGVRELRQAQAMLRRAAFEVAGRHGLCGEVEGINRADDIVAAVLHRLRTQANRRQNRWQSR